MEEPNEEKPKEELSKLKKKNTLTRIVNKVKKMGKGKDRKQDAAPFQISDPTNFKKADTNAPASYPDRNSEISEPTWREKGATMSARGVPPMPDQEIVEQMFDQVVIVSSSLSLFSLSTIPLLLPLFLYFLFLLGIKSLSSFFSLDRKRLGCKSTQSNSL